MVELSEERIRAVVRDEQKTHTQYITKTQILVRFVSDRSMRFAFCMAVTHSGEEHGEDVD